MNYLIVDCFNWIGFHIANELIEKGNQIDGIDNTSSSTRQAHLSMYMGRNSNFQVIQESELESKYDIVIYLNETSFIDKVKSKKIIQINSKQKIVDHENVVSIKVPLLFGEWMPMDEEGTYNEGKYIYFDSLFFITKAIYIKDFVKSLLQWIQSGMLPNKVNVFPMDEQEQLGEVLWDRANISHSKPVENVLSNVLAHYKQHKQSYLSIKSK